MIQSSIQERLHATALWVLDRALDLIPSRIHPNHLTHARWVLTVPTIILAKLDFAWSSVVLLIASSLCDILDGHLARRRGLTSENGAHLDARADKIFVHGVLWFGCYGHVNIWIAIAASSFDFVLSTLRWIKDRRQVTGKSNGWGKIKTWAQSFALAFVLSQEPFFTSLAPWTFFFALYCAGRSILGHLTDLRQAHQT